MPRDVHKSLELLEEFHSELFRPTDAELKHSIEKVIGIFKTNLFNALCDIHEYYENVLLNERLPLGQKIFESKRFADRWEQRQGLLPVGSAGLSSSPSIRPTVYSHYSAESREQKQSILNRSGSYPSTSPITFSRSNALLETAPVNCIIDSFGREWDVEEVTLDASQVGLGFSISGGKDRPPEPDHYIRITDITPGGAVANDGRIKVGDVILKVNEHDCVNVEHQFAVSALQTAGPTVRLLVKRLKPQRSLSQSQLNDLQYQQRMQDSRTATLTNRSRSLHQLPQQTGASSILQEPPTPQQRQPSRLSHHSGGGMQYITPQPPPESTRAPRLVTLRKGEGGLGFNIVGGEDGEPIYVSHVLPGGVADLSGGIKKGDVLLRVGDIDLQGATHGQSALTLKSIPPNSYVHLLVQYRPREYHQFEDKVERLRSDMLAQQQHQSPGAGFR
ncbi:PDZ domain (Also known as DHR or GLGF) domain-containing protein [Ditylenchus destructor]|uniref:PDZ domain (Also known as DHR or GLGF) domain-containing protein n=1 Tax=Ditylenchus destructor TaxID=166010 RepID=A0AAD4R617_9BILA|nr:PDZ domain (Also known as DHR or GLGF) domain-containing protein [Ditylenchus destructor]